MKQVNTNSLQCVPIVDRNRNLLPIHFAVDPGPLFNWLVSTSFKAFKKGKLRNKYGKKNQATFV